MSVGDLRPYNRGQSLKIAGSFSFMIFQIPDRQFMGGFLFRLSGCLDGRVIKTMGDKMKKYLIAGTAVVFATLTVPIMPAGAVMPTLCMSVQTCVRSPSCRSGSYCCPNGKQGTSYTCPTGWSYNVLYEECRRDATSGSDSKGSYTQNYGTCAPTTTTYACYGVTSNPPSPISCLACTGGIS